MSENVHQFGNVAPDNSRCAAFVQTVAQAFDRYVKDHGCEPDAIVYVLNGLKVASVTGWHITGESTSGTTSVLALAAVHMLAEASGTSRVLGG